MSQSIPGKVTAAHLERNAYLYVRQSTLQQVVENTESTARQYQLRQRAVAPRRQLRIVAPLRRPVRLPTRSTGTCCRRSTTGAFGPATGSWKRR